MKDGWQPEIVLSKRVCTESKSVVVKEMVEDATRVWQLPIMSLALSLLLKRASVCRDTSTSCHMACTCKWRHQTEDQSHFITCRFWQVG